MVTSAAYYRLILTTALLFRGQASILKSSLTPLVYIPHGAKLTFLNCLSTLVCSFYRPSPLKDLDFMRRESQGRWELSEFEKTRKLQLMGCWQATSALHILLPHTFCSCIHPHAYDFFYLLKRGSHFSDDRKSLNRIEYVLCLSSLI